MRKHINKVAVIGSGIMGSRIACHFANIGVEVLLLDIAPKELNENEKKKGLTLEDKAVKNRIVNEALQNTLKSNPSPIYLKKFAQRITTGNLTDDLDKIATADWIIEAVIENLNIKKQLFEQVEKYRKPGTIISTNTSGIPINFLLEGRSDDFQQNFLGTHFFNPPRYLPLLEIIPSTKTKPELVDFLMHYGEKYLGKTTVLCKDTPAFIANRIGVFSIMSLFHLTESENYTVEEIDKLTGPLIGRPKSATFRTCDVVGLDTLVKVADGLYQNCKNDEANALFNTPDFIKKMVEKNMLGSKTKQGFYKKVKDENGKSEILTLDLNTLEYRSKQKVKIPSLDLAMQEDNIEKRIKILFNAKDKAGDFFKKSLTALFEYVSNRIPEISDNIYNIDKAIKAGFGWKHGPFELWDIIGIEKSLPVFESLSKHPNEWVNKMLSAGHKSFYKIENGKRYYYAPQDEKYIEIKEDKLSLNILHHTNILWKNSGTTITDLGDGVINLEFHTKMNTIGSEVIEGINKAIDMAEENYKGLVIYNEGDNFSAGANVGLIFMMAIEQEFEELDFAIRAFQNTMMRVRYSNIPVIVAPHNLCLGGGTEMCLHADKVIAHAETYMGLVEFGVGVIPGGGGTKEFTLRASDEYGDGIRTNVLRNRFLTIGQAKVSTSAYEAFDLGYLRNGIDEVIVNRSLQLSYAKNAVINLYEKGYTKPIQRKDIKVLGNEGLGIVYVGAHSMMSGNYISEHDKLISEKLGYVMSGGNLSSPTEVSEQYLLDMERKAFLELCMEKKTLERLQSILTNGKVLRN
ncbi:MAG: 3-hydroxyacyl-CoA dehydrogenase/enoyl-CoA hydratase family protein [Vicingaceae bacterium]